MPTPQTRLPYSNLLNLVGYQAIWFGSIFLRDAFVPVALLLVLVHFWSCLQRRREAIVLICCATLGFACDNLLTVFGVYGFQPSPEYLPAPLWLAMIWLGFTATLRHGISFTIAKPALGIALAGIGAPLSYLAADRLGAVTFPLGSLTSAVIISAVWIALMSAFIAIVRFVDPDQYPRNY